MLKRWLNRLPIQRKLTFLVLSAVLTALLLSSVALLFKHWQFERAAMVRQLNSLCDLLGANTTASIEFDDNLAAQQLLDSLRLQPSIEAGYIYLPDGEIFTAYSHSKTSIDPPAAPTEMGHAFLGKNLLSVASPIESDDEVIGTIYIVANLDALNREIFDYSVIVLVVVLICSGITYLVCAPLQQSIAGPILDLANTAKRISAEEDYSIRVTKDSEDELGVLYDQFNRMLDQVETSKQELQEANDQLEIRVDQRTRQLSDANYELSNEVSERRRAELELERVHREFVEAARYAGMAEIASGVLHNVGNVLNSVNVSANTIFQRLKTSKRKQLKRLVDLFNEHSDDLGEFLKNDERGKQIPKFLDKLAESLETEDNVMMIESSSLTSNIEHIKAIIATQQSYAGTSGLVEPMNINELLEDVIKLNASSFDRHQIQIVRDFGELSELLVDKQRLLQIVINLVKNAKESLLEQSDNERVLRLTTLTKDDRLLVQISDTGVGIEPHNLTKVFSHGFSTKSGGHGFGLHSCANAAATMEGELTVESEGHMKGATFTLSLPCKPVVVASH
ncbi:ATP-binding protein [Aeoliella mucimassa]|uniref:histidine kinase n=1 Tax=Aeoliella mucimassa TaxID=2527972 RepID=A0A518AKJ7_9BACT|nr:ATP-binding protein [Aeoliella mucimassa]QDU55257.1 Sensor histidine kinase TodS [Aeoliella mucimassa]